MTVQINARVPDEVAAGLDRWSSATGVERSMLVRDILAQAVTARAEGRASFERLEAVSPVDVKHLVADLRGLQVELKRVLDQNIKRDAALVRSAREDSVGVSEARTAIVSRLAVEVQQVRDAVMGALAKLPAEQTTALAASPTFAAMVAALNAQAKAIRELIVAAHRCFEQPRTQVSYTVWDKDWSGRKVVAALAAVWLFSVGSYHGLARLLPASWVAVRSADLQMGEGDRTICAFLEYHLSTSSCVTRFDGDTMRAMVEARHIPGKRPR